MVTRIQKWGNSQGLRLPVNILESAALAVGDEVAVTAKDGVITIIPARRIRGKRNLQELVRKIPKNYRAEEADWGDPPGRETW